MVVDLVAVKHGFFNSTNQGEVYKTLGCAGNAQANNMDQPMDFDNDPYLFDKMSWCYFPGHTVYKMTRYSVTKTHRD